MVNGKISHWTNGWKMLIAVGIKAGTRDGEKAEHQWKKAEYKGAKGHGVS